MKKMEICILSIFLIFFGFVVFIYYKNNSSLNNNSNVEWGDYTKEIIDLNNISKSNKLDNITVSDNKIVIKNSGVYEFTGSFNGTIAVLTQASNVNIIFNGVDLTSVDGPALYISDSNYVLLTIEGENMISDTNHYSNEDSNGTIYSESNLTIDGGGSLKLSANYEDGIVSTKCLTIKNVSLDIISLDDGVRGYDSVIVDNANITIDASGDGIKTTCDTDEDLGYILVKSGDFDITSKNDAIDAETSLIINSGVFKIKSGSGDSLKNSQDSASAKGLKATKSIDVLSGEFEINSNDDSIHSNGVIKITDGTFNLSSMDDGIHADDTLTIDGGSINIKNSYEGLEASTIYINNGNISVVSTDDGINAASSNESSEDNFRRDSFSNSTGTIYINGGTVYINSYGDGLDSNGNIDMTNGSVIIEGPTNAGNGAIDYDGTFNISGGTLIALGSTGMDESPSSTSSQYILHFNVSNNEANTNIILTDEENNEIINYTPSKSYSSIVISDSSIKKGGIYTIKIGGSEFASVTATDIITNYGSRSNIGGMMIPGNRREQ